MSNKEVTIENLVLVIKENEDRADREWINVYEGELNEVMHYSIDPVSKGKMYRNWLDGCISVYMELQNPYTVANNQFAYRYDRETVKSMDVERREYIANVFLKAHLKGQLESAQRNGQKEGTHQHQEEVEISMDNMVYESRLAEKMKDAALTILSNVHIKQELKNKKLLPKSFVNFINSDVKFKEGLMTEFKNMFPFDKVSMLKMAICLLEESRIIIIPEGQFKEFYIALKEFMGGVEIGSRSRLNDCYKHTELEQKQSKKDLDIVNTKIDSLITKYQPV